MRGTARGCSLLAPERVLASGAHLDSLSVHLLWCALHRWEKGSPTTRNCLIGSMMRPSRSTMISRRVINGGPSANPTDSLAAPPSLQFPENILLVLSKKRWSASANRIPVVRLFEKQEIGHAFLLRAAVGQRKDQLRFVLAMRTASLATLCAGGGHRPPNPTDSDHKFGRSIFFFGGRCRPTKKKRERDNDKKEECLQKKKRKRPIQRSPNKSIHPFFPLFLSLFFPLCFTL